MLRFFIPLPAFPFILLYFLPALLLSQNYVVNGGFERQIPAEAGKLQAEVHPCRFSRNAQGVNTNALGWRTYDLQTPDLLIRDSVAGCPDFPAPHKGQRMMGLIMYHPFQDGQYAFDYHEMVQGSLARPLEAGKTYRVSFWTCTNDSLGPLHLIKVFGRKPEPPGKDNQARYPGYRPVHCGNFGFYFSESKIQQAENFMLSQVDFPVYPQINHAEIVDTRGEWRQITFLFRADRPYRYFLFGNFYSDTGTKIDMGVEEREALDIRNQQLSFWEKTKRIAYYLFDDFAVLEDDGSPIEQSLLRDKKYAFPEALLFDTGKSDLKPGSEDFIGQLAGVLQKNTGLRIEIGGHTDHTGNETGNRTLSENRAKAVFNALLSRGVDAARLTWKGYGESEPVASNDTEAGREQNRRVECRLLE